MCHEFLSNPSFYHALTDLDRLVAAEVQASGCPFCKEAGRGYVALHQADYPRAPRGLLTSSQEVQREYGFRFSLCCCGVKHGCRRRVTPPSVRFLGRKVYLGIVVVLLCALRGGFSTRRRRLLYDQVELSAQTLWRWRTYWCKTLVVTPFWQRERANHMPPVNERGLPGTWLVRIGGECLQDRLRRLLIRLMPLTARLWKCAEIPLPEILRDRVG